MNYEHLLCSRTGQQIHPGDRVVQPLWKRGSVRGVVEVSVANGKMLRELRDAAGLKHGERLDAVTGKVVHD